MSYQTPPGNKDVKQSAGPFNILVMRQKGRLRSFYVTGNFLVFLGVAGFFGCVLAVLSLFYIGPYWGLLQSDGFLRSENAFLKSQIISLKAELRKANGISLVTGGNPVADLIPPMAAKEEKPEELTKTELSATEEDSAKELGEARSLDDFWASLSEPSEAKLLEISNLSFAPKNRGWDFLFRLQKINPNQGLVQGYVWLLAEFTLAGQTVWAASPEGVEAPGDSPEHAKGHFFSIKSGKTVKATVPNIPGDAELSRVGVVVWSDQGELLLKDFFNLKD